MNTQQALNILQIFAEKAIGNGFFKTFADAMAYKAAVDTIAKQLTEQEQTILRMPSALPETEIHAG